MSVVDDYLKNLPEPQKAELERIRKIVKQTVPEAEEVISYGVPGFKYKGKYLITFAAFKDHLSLFPGSAPIGWRCIWLPMDSGGWRGDSASSRTC